MTLSIDVEVCWRCTIFRRRRHRRRHVSMSTTKCCRDREDPWTNLPTKIGRTVHHWWGGAHHPQRCCHSISANHAICWRCKIFRRRRRRRCRHVSMSTTKCCGDGEDPWTNSPTTIRLTIHHWWGGAHHHQRQPRHLLALYNLPPLPPRVDALIAVQYGAI